MYKNWHWWCATHMENMKFCKRTIIPPNRSYLVPISLFCSTCRFWQTALGWKLSATPLLCMQISTLRNIAIQSGAVQAGVISQYKLEAFCTNLRTGARRPPGGFGRIRGVEFFSRENRPRRRSQPLWVKPAGQKYVDNHIFVIRTCVMTTIVCRFCRSDWFRFLFAPTR